MTRDERATMVVITLPHVPLHSEKEASRVVTPPENMPRTIPRGEGGRQWGREGEEGKRVLILIRSLCFELFNDAASSLAWATPFPLSLFSDAFIF